MIDMSLFFLSFSIIHVYAALSDRTLVFPTFAFRLGCRVFAHYYVPSLELLFSPLNICICLCGPLVVYLSLCYRAVLIWIIIWYSQTRSIIYYYSKSLKTSTSSEHKSTILCLRLMLLITSKVLSSLARRNYTFLATSRRQARIEVAHHLRLIGRHR
jgi:hypothetical protein